MNSSAIGINAPKVSIIITNFNGIRTLEKCLSRILNSDYPNFDIIVIDNHSTDGSLELLRGKYPAIKLIMNAENIGFGAATNLGMRLAFEKFADYVLALNNDAYLEKNTISKLLTVAKNNPHAGIISPLIKRPDGSIWFAGGKINWWKMRASHKFACSNSHPFASDYICGCAMLISQKVCEKVGLFDERFFLYYEDADLSVRAKRAGFELLIDPTSSVEHDEQSNNNNSFKTYWLVLSGILFFKKNTPLFLKPWMSIYLLLRKVKNSRDRHKNPSEINAIVAKAYADANKLT